MTAGISGTVLEERYGEVRKVTLIGSAVDLVLGVAKILVGWLAHSQALIADGIHSLSDLATDLVVLYAARHAHREADEDHPYGHGRIETITTVALGISLIAVAVGIAWDAVRRINAPDMLVGPGLLALVVALVSVLFKEVIYQYTKRAARRLRSNMLMANAWHSRSDAVSSVVVVIGVGGAMLGYPYLDAVAAVVVAVMIARIGFELVRSSTRELIDTALEPQVIERIREEIFKVGSVRAVHMLRSRRSGGDALVDVHIQVDPRVSVSEGHQIGDAVRRRITSQVDEVTDVTVHIDPEDDEEGSTCDTLPLRETVIDALRQHWSGFPGIDFDKVTLHYLGGQLSVELVLPLDMVSSQQEAAELVRRLQAAAGDIEDIAAVNILFKA